MAGDSMPFAMECYERGILNKADTDGLELTFGNATAMVEMVERIGRGSAEYAIHVKGLELPMHDPRCKQGMGLHYNIHATGADHCSGIQDDLVIKRLAKGSALNEDGTLTSAEMSARKACVLYEIGLWRHLPNYVGLCIFVHWSRQQISDAVEAVTGWPTVPKELTRIVEHGLAMARIFNLREGFSPSDDKPPHRFFETAPLGPLMNESVDPGKLEAALQAYFELLGWDMVGIPTRGKLVELGMEWVCHYTKSDP